MTKEDKFIEESAKAIAGAMKEKEVDINDAQHPLRLKAIEILEAIAEELGQPTIFDCKKGDTKWYDFEDMIVEILNKN